MGVFRDHVSDALFAKREGWSGAEQSGTGSLVFVLTNQKMTERTCLL